MQLREELALILRIYYGERALVVVLNNILIYINYRVEEILREIGYITVYLPPYSPDYNSIKLTFSVLKSWVQRNYMYVRDRYNNFGHFLTKAVLLSQYDRFAIKHFKYAAGGLYIKRAELEQALEELRRQPPILTKILAKILADLMAKFLLRRYPILHIYVVHMRDYGAQRPLIAYSTLGSILGSILLRVRQTYFIPTYSTPRDRTS